MRCPRCAHENRDGSASVCGLWESVRGSVASLITTFLGRASCWSRAARLAGTLHRHVVHA